MSEDPYQPLRLKDLAVGERPQERLEKLGPGALSDTELLAMLLRSGGKGHSVLIMAQQLMTEAGSLATLVRWGEMDFRRLKGIGRINTRHNALPACADPGRYSQRKPSSGAQG